MFKPKYDGELNLVEYTDRYDRTTIRIEINFRKGTSGRNLDALLKRGKALFKVNKVQQVEADIQPK